MNGEAPALGPGVVHHETNAQGVGIMYRIIDLASFFQAVAEHNFGDQSLTLQIRCADSFLPENDGALTVRFGEGRPNLAPEARPDARISLPVAQLSSLLMGAADFHSLQGYGLAEIDDPTYSDRVHRLFLSSVRPVCLTAF
jgi:predicted acetyltransferase